MYKCDNPKCNGIFEEPGIYKEYHNEIEDPEEADEIEDDENEIDSFEYLVLVRYNSLLGYYRNAYFYAATAEEAAAIKEKFLKKDRTKLCRVYKLIDAEEADNDKVN